MLGSTSILLATQTTGISGPQNASQKHSQNAWARTMPRTVISNFFVPPQCRTCTVQRMQATRKLGGARFQVLVSDLSRDVKGQNAGVRLANMQPLLLETHPAKKLLESEPSDPKRPGNSRMHVTCRTAPVRRCPKSLLSIFCHPRNAQILLSRTHGLLHVKHADVYLKYMSCALSWGLLRLSE